MPAAVDLAAGGTAARSAAPRPDDPYRVTVLGAFGVVRGDEPVDLPTSTGRLVALLALGGRPMWRTRVANELWHGKHDERAQANLRSTLWRLRQGAPGLIDVGKDQLHLGSGVHVDLAELSALARDLQERRHKQEVESIDPEIFCAELLPDWTDEFVDIRRELVRQMRLHALEDLARRLKEAGALHRALHVALTAVGQCPLRETSHQLVIEIHLAEGNICEAIRQFELLTAALWKGLRMHPSPAARALLAAYPHALARALGRAVLL